jgi:hypothetical protein
VQIFSDHFKPARVCQRHHIEPVSRQLFAQDILADGTLQKALILLTAYPTHHHPDHQVQVPAV